jgi:hypothetical protein
MFVANKYVANMFVSRWWKRRRDPGQGAVDEGVEAAPPGAAASGLR